MNGRALLFRRAVSVGFCSIYFLSLLSFQMPVPSLAKWRYLHRDLLPLDVLETFSALSANVGPMRFFGHGGPEVFPVFTVELRDSHTVERPRVIFTTCPVKLDDCLAGRFVTDSGPYALAESLYRSPPGRGRLSLANWLARWGNSRATSRDETVSDVVLYEIPIGTSAMNSTPTRKVLASFP